MRIIDLIEALTIELKNMGNVEVKLFNNFDTIRGLSDFCIEQDVDMVDVSSDGSITEYVPVPVLTIIQKEN